MADVILDACCLINLCASGALREILRSSSHRWYVCEGVMNETQFVYAQRGEERVKEPIDFHPWLADGTLIMTAVKGGDELALYVHYAAVLDDGEAMCMAIARARKWTLATDDRKGRAIAAADGVALVSTAEIIQMYGHSVSASGIADVIRKVAELARFTPPTDSPDVDWWQSHLS